MAFTLSDIIIVTTIGVISSLTAPWAKWGVEKRKRKLGWRKEIINNCKRIINKRPFYIGMFKETSFYSNIQPLLTTELQQEMKREWHTPGKLKSPEERKSNLIKDFALKKKLLDEINIIEKKWGLI